MPGSTLRSPIRASSCGCSCTTTIAGAHCAGYPDVAARLRKWVPGYDKSRLDFGAYSGGIPDAIRRARSLEGGPARNPSTNVWQVVEVIMERAA